MKKHARIDYARTSTIEQNLESQVTAFANAGCTMARTEQNSGAHLDDRREPVTILDFIRDGETLVVTRIDRLARSMRDLQIIVDRLKPKGAHLAATEQPADTSKAIGNAVFDMPGVFAEFETNPRRERQVEGIAAAKSRGVYKARPPKIDMDDIKRRLSDSARPVDIACDLGFARSTVYKAKAQLAEIAAPQG